MASPAYRDPAYVAERAALLGLPCLWRLERCTGVADTADHVPALSEHEHRRGSGCCRLVASCRSCNIRRGGWRAATKVREARRRGLRPATLPPASRAW